MADVAVDAAQVAAPLTNAGAPARMPYPGQQGNRSPMPGLRPRVILVTIKRQHKYQSKLSLIPVSLRCRLWLAHQKRPGALNDNFSRTIAGRGYAVRHHGNFAHRVNG